MNSHQQGRILVALSGPSSSGKSTVAKSLHSLLDNSVLIHLDNFYLPDEEIPYNESLKEKNWDCPEAIGFEKFKAYIFDIRNGGEFRSIDSLEIEPDLFLSQKEFRELKSYISEHPTSKCAQIVLVDGFMLFHDKSIMDLFDVKLFLHASYDTLVSRRENRKGYNTVAGFWVDPPNYFQQMVWPEYEKHHRYLFEQGDVNSTLTSHAREKLKISDFRNDGKTPIKKIVEWSLAKIFEAVENMK